MTKWGWMVVCVALTGCGGSDGDGDTGRSDAGRTDGGMSGGADTGGADPECRGSATDCSLVSTASCESQDGCNIEGECTGFSRSCSSYTSSTDCRGQLGCTWTTSSSTCSGSAWTCDTTFAEENCRGLEGCTWTDTCDGFPNSCLLITTQTSCETQMGCRWE